MQTIFSFLLRIHRHPKLKRYDIYNSARLDEHLLFIHAIFGCETTSRLFGLGKGIVVKKLSDSHFYKSTETFTKKNVSKEDVIFVGDTALVLLYGGSCAEGLDSLRYKRFCDKVPKSTSPVDPQSLPLTSAAAKYHSLRVHYKVMVWKEFNHDLKPEDWGWYADDGRLMPLQTDQPAAQVDILNVICCSCAKYCSTNRCTCHKYGMHCTPVCGECRGVSSTNSQLPDLSNDDMNDNNI